MSKGGNPTFTENDSVKETWKNSVFKNLFSDRKKLFDSYPNVNKGLVFSDPTIKFGSGSYSFKTSDVVDKATYKHKDHEFQARYKKDAKKFDVSFRQKMSNNYTALFKYENRGGNEANYVIGCDFDQCGVLGNAKFNPFTGIFKTSAQYDLNKIVDGVKVAGDLKIKTKFLDEKPAFNVGMVYDSGFGVSGLAFNHKGQLTANHYVKVDKNLSAAVEFVEPTNGGDRQLAIAAGYKIDNEHEVRGRFNKKGELSMALKKDFSPQCSVQLGTVLDTTNPILKAPLIGFKLNAKMG